MCKNHCKLTHFLLALSLVLIPMQAPLAAVSHGTQTDANGTVLHSGATADTYLLHHGNDGQNMPANVDKECGCLNCDGCCIGCAHLNQAVSNVLDMQLNFDLQSMLSPGFDPFKDPFILSNFRPPNRQLS